MVGRSVRCFRHRHGIAEIRAVVSALTDRPVTVLSSHSRHTTWVTITRSRVPLACRTPASTRVAPAAEVAGEVAPSALCVRCPRASTAPRTAFGRGAAASCTYRPRPLEGARARPRARCVALRDGRTGTSYRRHLLRRADLRSALADAGAYTRSVGSSPRSPRRHASCSRHTTSPCPTTHFLTALRDAVRAIVGPLLAARQALVVPIRRVRSSCPPGRRQPASAIVR